MRRQPKAELPFAEAIAAAAARSAHAGISCPRWRIARFLIALARTLGTAGPNDPAAVIPLTLAQLSEALGLTRARAAQALALLASAGIARLEQGHIRILDWRRLQAAADGERAPRPGPLPSRSGPIAWFEAPSSQFEQALIAAP